MSTAIVVKGFEITRFTLPLVRPISTAVGRVGAREVLILKLVDDRGAVGLGEAAPLPGFSIESVIEAERELGAALSGPLRAFSFRRVEDLADLLEGSPISPSGRHALEQALLGLLGHRRNVSVAELLHPGARRSVPIHALVQGPEDAREAAHRGAEALKVKVGATTREEDASRLAAIRAEVGPVLPIRIDANGVYSVTEAIAALARFAPFGLQSIEQPVAAADLDGMAEVRRRARVPVLADESVRTLEDLRAVIQHDAADAIVLKPMLCGGLLAARAMAYEAARVGLPVSVTTVFESAIGRRAALDVASACPGTLWTSGLDTARFLELDLRPAPETGSGVLVESRALHAAEAWDRATRPSPPRARGRVWSMGGQR